jgi:hypothetical protein
VESIWYYVEDYDIPMISFEKSERKEAVANQHRAAFNLDERRRLRGRSAT